MPMTKQRHGFLSKAGDILLGYISELKREFESQLGSYTLLYIGCYEAYTCTPSHRNKKPVFPKYPRQMSHS